MDNNQASETGKDSKEKNESTSGREIILIPAVLGEKQKVIMPPRIFMSSDSKTSSHKPEKK